ncbi:hypothetical protein BA059_19220 [Mycolicibacterium sp. (ex Dasyatis americana)]|uniref:Uncharacterized protein n=1 Tax=Mycobacterium syngnathidarum TaxID=1908205 RepID=A0A1Q9W8T9_9MYCO|nr:MULTISPECIES: hypothetical protein [Mycobacterium]OFB37325.1 hypothetical protein BA059_19220 [Mycolicibacterium sp. (ex Dasyatis americana)]MCG7610080.1 hypothetical protein [Mycobacterium sp. CnD-18-1]OHU06913.1 hypothetical protein BKG61_06715 [Mycobacterium syngnathidarum]OLT95122.1 hypothetical protein BKG60_18270 [Mycobacterium syngnathidarum]TMS53926.1 hypothetical protein E0T84_09110 [Mycobacterium sp. DBP42]
MAALEDLEARVAALEADRFDYRAVLAAINALGANQRDQGTRLTSVEGLLTSVEGRLASVETELADFRLETRARFRSVDEHLAEIKDLIIGRR